jgi:hypothetical protein
VVIPNYSNFPVIETMTLSDTADIRILVDKMVDDYEIHERSQDFSYRILLPRGDKLTAKAKRLGHAFQGEFILGLRRRHLVPRIREVRYIHNEQHYGWILSSPELLDRFISTGGS